MSNKEKRENAEKQKRDMLLLGRIGAPTSKGGRSDFPPAAFPEAPVRAEDLRYIMNCIRQGECCSVVSPSNTGKSILLKSLLTEEIRQGCAREEAVPLMVFVDCLGAGDTAHSFYELLLRRIMEELEGSDVSRATVDAFRDLHREVLRSTTDLAVRSLFASSMRALGRETRIRLVLILDEFDDVFRALPPWPFRQLRVLRDKFGAQLCYVAATSRHLERLRSDPDTYEFRELFHPYTWILCPLCEEDIQHFITYLAQARGMVLDEERTSLASELSGGHPGLLTHVCRILSTWELGQLPQRETIVDELGKDPTIQKECRRLWDELEQEEQDGLLALVGGGEAALDAERRRALRAKGLVVTREDGRLTVFAPIFEGFVRSELTKRRGGVPRGIRCDEQTGQIWVDDREVTLELSEPQRKLVRLLCQKVGAVCTKDEIAQAVWPEAKGDVFDAAIYELVKRVRKKVEPDWKDPRYIVTVPGEGYRLQTPE
jgi:hypothetical protein